MSVLLIPGVAGTPANVDDYNDNLDLIEASLLDVGPFVISGLVPSAGAGLTAAVSSGVASIGGRITVAGFNITGLTNSTLNHLYLLNTGAGTSNTTGTAPANSVKLGTATTAGGVVTSVDTSTTSGRQTKLTSGGTAILASPNTFTAKNIFQQPSSVAQTTYSFAGSMFQVQDLDTSSEYLKVAVTKNTNPNSGLMGLHIDAKATDTAPHGISLDHDGVPLVDFGIDTTTTDLAFFSHALTTDFFRFRLDTGQLAMGPVVGQPAGGGAAQLQLYAGIDGGGRVGMLITTYGNQDSLQLLQGTAGSGRAKINFDDKFQFGSDAQNNDSSNWWIYHNDTSNFLLYATTADSIGINMGSGPAAPSATLHITRANAASNPSVKSYLKVVGVGDTALTLQTEHPDIIFELQRTVQWATGNFADQRFVKILAPTMGFVGASTVDRATTLYIDNAPIAGSNATLSQRYALWVDAGKVRLDGDGTHVLELPADATDPTGGGGAAVGRIPVLIGGTLRHIAYY